MTADPTPPQRGSTSDESKALLELLGKGEQDHRPRRTLDARVVDERVRTMVEAANVMLAVQDAARADR